MKKQSVYKSTSFIGIILCLFCYVVPSFAQKSTSCPVSPRPPFTDTSWYAGSGGFDTTFGTNGVLRLTPTDGASRLGINNRFFQNLNPAFFN